MAKVKNAKGGGGAAKKKAALLPAPAELTMRLFTPGMSVMHRAGLGGLACTLRYIEREQKAGRLLPERLPGGPWAKEGPPWQINTDEITLRFGKPEAAREFLRRLFALGFDIRENLIYLPGQYSGGGPNQAVRAEIQQGLSGTFLQHGRVRTLGAPSTVQHDPEGEGMPGVRVMMRPCTYYTHQNGWQELTTEETGCLIQTGGEVSGPLNPGAVVRHVAFTADTRIEDGPELLLPLYFALVGSLALPINARRAALIVPDVNDLLWFTQTRPTMTPASVRESQTPGAADAALWAQVRLAATQSSEQYEVLGCLAMVFASTPWASQQRSRVRTMMVPPARPVHLTRFRVAMQCLPTRIVVRTRQETSGRGRQKTTTEVREAFRFNSVVRPLVAENLALCRPWYAGFGQLMTALDDSNRPLRDRVGYEREGLNTMSNEPGMWDLPGEQLLVCAVHEALRCRYGKIAAENKNVVTMRARFQSEYDRWRLAFVRSKTADQIRNSLCDLFSRAGNNDVLRNAWRQVLPMLADGRWRLARDLALFALASYTGQGAGQDNDTELQPTSEETAE